MKQTLILGVAATLFASGCGVLLDNPAPEEARLIIDGEAGKPIRVITSSVFVASVNDLGQTLVQLFEADTVFTTLPYQHVHGIDEDHRFFVEASRVDDDLESIHVEVYVDDRKQFDQGGTLIPDHPYRFVYTFNQATTRDIRVL
jgi:hypothetical protein